MSSTPTQSLANHGKIVPPFHYFGLPILTANALWSLYRAGTRPGVETVLAGLVAVAILVMFLFTRVMVLTVQDRVIRLEMRLRMRELFPADLAARIPEFTAAQLIALRFASDRELPALSRKVLDEKIADRREIKKLVTQWQADHLRA